MTQTDTIPGKKPGSEEFLYLLTDGSDLMRAGRLKEAKRQFEDALKFQPDDEQAKNFLGLCQFRMGELDDAEAIFGQLVHNNPVEPSLRLNLALVFLKQERLEEAEKTLHQVLDLAPDHKRAANYLAMLLDKQERFAEAAKWYTTAGNTEPAATAKRQAAEQKEGAVLQEAKAAEADRAEAEIRAKKDAEQRAEAERVRTETVKADELKAQAKAAEEAEAAAKASEAAAEKAEADAKARAAEENAKAIEAKTREEAARKLAEEAAQKLAAARAKDDKTKEQSGAMPRAPSANVTASSRVVALGDSEATIAPVPLADETSFAEVGAAIANSAPPEVAPSATKSAPRTPLPAGAQAAALTAASKAALDTQTATPTDDAKSDVARRSQMNFTLGEATPAPTEPSASTANESAPPAPPAFALPAGASRMSDLLRAAHPNATDSGLVRVPIEDILYLRTDRMVSLTGELEVEPINRRYRGRRTDSLFGGNTTPLCAAMGSGECYLDVGEQTVRELRLNNEDIYLVETNLLAFTDGLVWENGRLPAEDGDDLDIVHLRGTGRLYLLAGGPLMALPIKAQQPVTLRANRLCGWSGQVVPYRGPFPGMPASAERPPIVRFEGEGMVIAS